MKYWITDEDSTAQRLPLGKMFSLIKNELGDDEVVVQISRSSGYGDQIKAIDNALNTQDSVQLPLAEFERLIKGTDEWFYDLVASVQSESEISIRFGLHDSTALFLEAPREFARHIVEQFKNVQEAQID